MLEKILQEANAVSDLVHQYMFIAVQAYREGREISEDELDRSDIMWRYMSPQETETCWKLSNAINMLRDMQGR